MPKLSNPEGPRVPRHAAADLIGEQRTIQVNHCRNPECDNYGVAPRTMPGKTGPGAGRDPHYRLHSTNRGQVPALLCKACNQKPPVKSNNAVAEEIDRLIGLSSWRTLGERTACKTQDCRNRGRTVAAHPREYTRRGRSPSGGQYYECKHCRHRVLASNAPRLRNGNRARAADVFSRIANKSPILGVVRGAGLNSPAAYYRILDYIYARCREFSGQFDRAMLDGRIRLPRFMVVESDAQTYQINWASRMDRRNAEISSYASVHSYSRYILGLHANLDSAADPFAVNSDAAQIGDMSAKEPYRKYARYWLAGDDMRAGRSKNFQTRGIRRELATAIEALYAGAASRGDVEDIELEHMDTAYRTPFLNKGMLIHMPYTTYAHWYLLRRLLLGAGVSRFQMHFDISSTSRAAFLCSFIKEIKEGRAHGFYVRYTKDLTVGERKAAVAKSEARRKAVMDGLPPEDQEKVDLIMMKEALAAGGRRYGEWGDLWFDHPNPTMNEPHKAMSWQTPDKSLDKDTVAKMYLRGRLARVDNVFQLTRRLFNAFERPLGTPSGQNLVWSGYQPYNPTIVEKYLAIFRVVSNWIQVGDDGRTPAMRLGLASAPLRYADILRADAPISYLTAMPAAA